MLFLDLDDFKTINDTFGHDAGDRVLQTISARLRSALRESDTAARVGGDEFAVLLEDVANETAVSEIVADLLGVISAPLWLDGKEVSVECSIGIAVVSSTGSAGHATTVDELLRNADVAMYQAKAADGNTFRHFRPEMQETVVEQLALRADLKAAIAANELTLAYQPIFDLETDEITGYEALLRWEHAVRGNVSPATFIPVAEDSGLIVPLGRWVLERACEDAVSFQRDDPGPHDRVLSVNISAQQLARVELVDEVRSALRSSGLDPHCLMLEITESLLISDVELAIERLSALRELGVRIAIDDFGTGYSSLSYILQLPIDVLKIDKRFIDSVDGDDQGEQADSGDHRPGPRARPPLRRRGGRTARAARAAQGARLRLRAGLPARPPDELRCAAGASDGDRRATLAVGSDRYGHPPLGFGRRLAKAKGPEPSRFRAFLKLGRWDSNPQPFGVTAECSAN